MSRSETGIAGPPPDFGEHTAGVLERFLGLAGEEVEALVAAGIVATEGGPDVEGLLA
jgi:crotonobetainyl-CoA:carnitine CoA-transferase CaiB-like acyl-CoA transferase